MLIGFIRAQSTLFLLNQRLLYYTSKFIFILFLLLYFLLLDFTLYLVHWQHSLLSSQMRALVAKNHKTIVKLH
jgi:hypothetical protein